jgi:hypothetical protein
MTFTRKKPLPVEVTNYPNSPQKVQIENFPPSRIDRISPIVAVLSFGVSVWALIVAFQSKNESATAVNQTVQIKVLTDLAVDEMHKDSIMQGQTLYLQEQVESVREEVGRLTRDDQAGWNDIISALERIQSEASMCGPDGIGNFMAQAISTLRPSRYNRYLEKFPNWEKNIDLFLAYTNQLLVATNKTMEDQTLQTKFLNELKGFLAYAKIPSRWKTMELGAFDPVLKFDANHRTVPIP